MHGGRFIRCAAIFSALGAFVLFSSVIFREATSSPGVGFTFSTEYARSLGLEPQEVLSAALEDFDPAFVRVPLYWKDIEPTRGVFSWEEMDEVVELIRAEERTIHMVMGAKVPRWPECFIPSWVMTHDRLAYEETLLSSFRIMVSRYASSVDVWQIENEPFFPFGDCPETSLALLREEVALIRELDPSASLQFTVSGEQQMWTSVAPLADRVGVSMYRSARNAWFGAFTFPVPSWWYILMRFPLLHTHEVVISELQMEPWFVSHPRFIDPGVAASYFTPRHARDAFTYARSTGFSEISFWGVEWWYYLREHGYPGLWDAMKDLIGDV
ncbi:hypothetical protein EBT31_13350 [bacterium]|nr:hypothetical protein [bacterium]